MKDAVATMGGLLPDDAGGRDAVHVAVFSAVSEQQLMAGDHVCVQQQPHHGDVVVFKGSITFKETVGIVDPFLKVAVRPGERFWVYLYPRSITGLSHRWSHPAFEETTGSYATPATKLESEKWLRDFCASGVDCPDYADLIYFIGKALDNGGEYTDAQDTNEGPMIHIDSDYVSFYGSDAHGEIPPEFWDHMENVLGRKISIRPSYFSCSC